ncbi:hypothetical protein ATE84_1148 [Aquimarina sp. MAR_2010_214]|nr:hypothetical protein ATE84_1148 [Aquimarina sp. MAR_2010_214]
MFKTMKSMIIKDRRNFSYDCIAFRNMIAIHSEEIDITINIEYSLDGDHFTFF